MGRATATAAMATMTGRTRLKVVPLQWLTSYNAPGAPKSWRTASRAVECPTGVQGLFGLEGLERRRASGAPRSTRWSSTRDLWTEGLAARPERDWHVKAAYNDGLPQTENAKVLGVSQAASKHDRPRRLGLPLSALVGRSAGSGWPQGWPTHINPLPERLLRVGEGEKE